jgi:2-polyprenyl-6-methoxyphenol hydroxylase-like FAD-dependent oxidoreductase
LEDAAILLDGFEKAAKTVTIEEVFRIFEKRRLQRTHNIVNRSWQIGKMA